MVIRKAEPADFPAVLDLMRQLAGYEQLEPPNAEAQARLERDALGDLIALEVWVVELDGEISAYAVTFPTYSTFRGKPGLYLEDLFVAPTARRRGVATAMLKHLRTIAEARGCGRFEWLVLEWNKDAQALYRGVGAEIMSQWCLCRVSLP